jgi:hypothetical protein
MFGLPDLPVCDAPAFPQVSQKGLNILFGPIFQRFFRQEIGEVSCPVHIEWGTIRPNPVLLRARPVGFPKNIAIFGIARIHVFHHGNLFYFKGLNKNQVFHDRQNYHIII